MNKRIYYYIKYELLVDLKIYINLEDKWNILESGDIICLKYIKEKLKKSYLNIYMLYKDNWNKKIINNFVD